MCNLETSWEKPEEQCAAVYDANIKLAELEKDELIELLPFTLKIKDTARPFIRNICMCFDARLWRSVPQSTIFSKVV
jgi:oxygen-independent coproporphyrinogen-3 oxidase